MWPQPAMVIGDVVTIDVFLGIDELSDEEIANARVSVRQRARDVELVRDATIRGPRLPPPLQFDGCARWSVELLAGRTRIVVSGLEPGNAMIGISLRKRTDTPPREYKVAEKMIRINELAMGYLETLCVGVDLELETTSDDHVALNLGMWQRAFQDEIKRQSAVVAASASEGT